MCFCGEINAVQTEDIKFSFVCQNGANCLQDCTFQPTLLTSPCADSKDFVTIQPCLLTVLLLRIPRKGLGGLAFTVADHRTLCWQMFTLQTLCWLSGLDLTLSHSEVTLFPCLLRFLTWLLTLEIGMHTMFAIQQTLTDGLNIITLTLGLSACTQRLRNLLKIGARAVNQITEPKEALRVL